MCSVSFTVVVMYNTGIRNVPQVKITLNTPLLNGVSRTQSMYKP